MMLIGTEIIIVLGMSAALFSFLAIVSGENNSSSNHNQLRRVYSGKRSSPNWPLNFIPVSIKQYNVKNKNLLAALRKIEGGRWKKVYEDGYLVAGMKVSIHYFRSKSGKIFDLKVKDGWSNP